MADGVRYVLSRLNWRPAADGRFVRLPGAVPVAAFADPEAAEADRRRREAAAREHVNPFALGDALCDLTDLPAAALRDWVQEAGVEPPAGADDLAAWREWWQAADPAWTPAVRAKVWDGLTKARFYAVENQPLRPVAYAVVEVCWRYNDVGWDAAGEGGVVRALHQTREAAERAAAELTAVERARQADVAPGRVYGTYRTADRERELADPFAPFAPRPGPYAEDTWAADGVDFFEVVEVAWEGDG